MNEHPTADFPRRGPSWSRVNQWLLWLGLAAAVIWLVTKHSAHQLEVAPFLLVLACPLMHFFGHGGHGHGEHRNHSGHAADERSGRQPLEPRSSTDEVPRGDA